MCVRVCICVCAAAELQTFNRLLISHQPQLYPGVHWASAKLFQPANKAHSTQVALQDRGQSQIKCSDGANEDESGGDLSLPPHLLLTIKPQMATCRGFNMQTPLDLVANLNVCEREPVLEAE